MRESRSRDHGRAPVRTLLRRPAVPLAGWAAERFRDAPIRRKLVAVILLTNVLLLVASAAVFLVNEALTFRKDARAALESTAALIGGNSVAAVVVRSQLSPSNRLSSAR